MADRVAAAIRRASQQARNAMQQLDSAAIDELQRIYSAAADDVRATIAAAGGWGSGGRVRLDQMRALLERVDQVLAALATARDALLLGTIDQAAALGVRPLTGAGIAATGRTATAPLAAVEAMRTVDEAVRFVHHFQDADGLMLSDRLWRLSAGAKDAVARTVEQAVVRGWSADRAAQELIMRGQPVTPALQMGQAAASTSQVMRAADLLADPNGMPLGAAQRVMRTEVNRAHGEAYMAGAARAQGFVGFRFLLSPRHPRPDICDLLARQNLHGLGAGVYPDRKRCPWPAHPNTLSFVVAVFDDEVTADDRAGTETTLQALDRLGPELRAGVLGPTKASYFDRGVLTTGMVRAKVGAVRERLSRRGQG